MISLTSYSKNLENIVRKIEENSGEAVEMLVTIQGNEYLVGDLRERAGPCRLEMSKEYEIITPSPIGANDGPERKQNPYYHWKGTYSSFEDLNKKVNDLKSSNEKKGFHLDYCPGKGCFAVISNRDIDEPSIIGQVVFSLLSASEEVKTKKID